MIGQDLAHYRITARIGKGGMGEVYLAHDLSLDRKVASGLALSRPRLDVRAVLDQQLHDREMSFLGRHVQRRETGFFPRVNERAT